MLSLIVAMGNDRVIGQNGAMPWHLPADLAWFKRNTLGKPVIMGRKTWDSIGRPLPHRQNIVISRDASFQPIGALSVITPEAALTVAASAPEVMIIGGAQIYAHFLPFATRLYLTLIHANFAGDTFFPDYTQYAWREVERIEHPADTKNPYPYTFLILER